MEMVILNYREPYTVAIYILVPIQRFIQNVLTHQSYLDSLHHNVLTILVMLLHTDYWALSLCSTSILSVWWWGESKISRVHAYLGPHAEGSTDDKWEDEGKGIERPEIWVVIGRVDKPIQKWPLQINIH